MGFLGSVHAGAQHGGNIPLVAHLDVIDFARIPFGHHLGVVADVLVLVVRALHNQEKLHAVGVNRAVNFVEIFEFIQRHRDEIEAIDLTAHFGRQPHLLFQVLLRIGLIAPVMAVDAEQEAVPALVGGVFRVGQQGGRHHKQGAEESGGLA